MSTSARRQQELDADADTGHLLSSAANVVTSGATIGSLPEPSPILPSGPSASLQGHVTNGRQWLAERAPWLPRESPTTSQLPLPEEPFHESTGVDAGSTMAALGTATGVATTAEGITAYRAASERMRRAEAAHDAGAARVAGDERVNAAATTTSGALGTASSGASLVQRGLIAAAPTESLLGNTPLAARTAGRIGAAGTVGRVLGQGAGVVNAAQGGYNIVRGYQNRHASGDRPDQQMSDGVLQLVGGLGAVAGGLGAPLSAGIVGGMALHEVANAHARESGIFDQSDRTAERGMAPTAATSEPAANDNNSADDMAVAAGRDVANFFGGGDQPGRVNGDASNIAGSVAAGVFGIATNAFSLAHQAGLAAPIRGTADIEARQAEERGAPLARSDLSHQAELRRQMRRHRDRDAAATAQGIAAHHAAVDHQPLARDMMAPERAAADASFTAINGAHAARNIQGHAAYSAGAYGGFTQADIDRAVLEQ